jgi:hypothetical protein
MLHILVCFLLLLGAQWCAKKRLGWVQHIALDLVGMVNKGNLFKVCLHKGVWYLASSLSLWWLSTLICSLFVGNGS